MEALVDYGYLGVSLLSFIGSSSVAVPIPYIPLLLPLTGLLNPFLFAAAAGLGSALGEIFAYAAGYAGRRVLGKRHESRLNAVLKLLERYGITLIVFIFVLAPLPVDLLFIPLGMLRISLWKIFPPAIAGKFLMFLIIAYGGKLIWDIYAVDWEIMTAITAILLALIIVAMIRIDWERVMEKYLLK